VRRLKWQRLLLAVFFATHTSVFATSVEELKKEFGRPADVPYPSHNPHSKDKENLGKHLFFDPRLSQSNMISCASCHNPSFLWSDGLPRGVGHGHKGLDRKVPTLLNVAWGWSFFWDGRAKTLEEQALMPIQSEKEMNTKLPELVEKVKSIAEYQPLFEKAFPGEVISETTIAKAIATFERGIVSGVAPFDWWLAGDEKAIPESAKRGFILFNHKAACVQCHNGWNFTNGSFADTGVAAEDQGRGKIVGNEHLSFAFKTPTLRNISQRAPYMHDGSLGTLAEVIEHYNAGGKFRRKTTMMFLPQPLNLTAEEKKDLLAFLNTLTSEERPMTLPLLPLATKEGPWERVISSTK